MPDERAWGIGPLKQKLSKCLLCLLKITCNLHQLSNPLMDVCNLVLVWNVALFTQFVVLVFLFLIQLHFLHSKSISEVIWKKYGQNTVKKLRKLEKFDYRF